jgi:pilus assembly protein CpaF
MFKTQRAKSAPTKSHLNGHVDRFEYEFQKVKSQLHQQLVEQLDLTKLARLPEPQLKQLVRNMAENACRSRNDVLGELDRERLARELMDEVFGLGPLERLMNDSTISDILVNNSSTVYIERGGQLELTDIVFADDDHLLRIIQRIVARVGRRIDEVSPMVDARLPDGSRVNAIIPPLALDGPVLSIRRFGANPLTITDLVDNSSILPEMVKFLEAAVVSRISFLISGGTGAGKTTLLNALSAFIPPKERVITIEDSAELILQHRHRVRLETRPANAEGVGELTQRDLVRNSLRMRPDRILVGEVRGPEVWDMLQAMNTGHEGSLTTVHANSALDALARLEMMVAMTGFNLKTEVVRNYIRSGINLIVHLARLAGGPRRVLQISEIVEAGPGDYAIEDVFGFEQTDVDSNGVAVGHFFVTGYKPKCLSRIRAAGFHLSDDLFTRRRLADPVLSGRREVAAER